jgi:hypothetical protein
MAPFRRGCWPGRLAEFAFDSGLQHHRVAAGGIFVPRRLQVAVLVPLWDRWSGCATLRWVGLTCAGGGV